MTTALIILTLWAIATITFLAFALFSKPTLDERQQIDRLLDLSVIPLTLEILPIDNERALSQMRDGYDDPCAKCVVTTALRRQLGFELYSGYMFAYIKVDGDNVRLWRIPPRLAKLMSQFDHHRVPFTGTFTLNQKDCYEFQ